MPRWQLALAAAAILGGIALHIPLGMERAVAPNAVSPASARASAPLEVPPTPEGMETLLLDVTGMTCDGCAATARMAVSQVGGVHDAGFLHESAQGFVTFDPDVTNPTDILGELSRLTGVRADVVDRN
ncbi:MAG: heavy-metal-associated domain-containing protein [Gemmatimonadota bacterium]